MYDFRVEFYLHFFVSFFNPVAIWKFKNYESCHNSTLYYCGRGVLVFKYQRIIQDDNGHVEKYNYEDYDPTFLVLHAVVRIIVFLHYLYYTNNGQN